MRINWREVCKFLSGAFLITALASWYIAWLGLTVPFIGMTMSPRFLFYRGFIHFGNFLIATYFGWIRKINSRP